MTSPVLTLGEISPDSISPLLGKYDLQLSIIGENSPIPGSFWGDSEAGLIDNMLYVRKDTPIHSLLHETCHYICMDTDRRSGLHTDAGGDYDEENAVCYLQILLAGYIQGVGSQRLMQDMDIWGYTFRLGSAVKWFQHDAEDAKQWLLDADLIDQHSKPTFHIRTQ